MHATTMTTMKAGSPIMEHQLTRQIRIQFFVTEKWIREEVGFKIAKTPFTDPLVQLKNVRRYFWTSRVQEVTVNRMLSATDEPKAVAGSKTNDAPVKFAISKPGWSTDFDSRPCGPQGHAQRAD